MGYNNYYSGSSAYDLSLFEPRPQYVRQESTRSTAAHNAKKKISSSKRTASRTAAAMPAKRRTAFETSSVRIANRRALTVSIALACAFAAVVTGLVISRMQYYELVLDIEDKEQHLEELMQDYEAMRVTFDTRMSNEAVEAYAVNTLGMHKRENSQTEYITLGGGEIFEITTEKKPLFGDGLGKLSSFIS